MLVNLDLFLSHTVFGLQARLELRALRETVALYSSKNTEQVFLLLYCVCMCVCLFLYVCVCVCVWLR